MDFAKVDLQGLAAVPKDTSLVTGLSNTFRWQVGWNFKPYQAFVIVHGVLRQSVLPGGRTPAGWGSFDHPLGQVLRGELQPGAYTCSTPLFYSFIFRNTEH